MTEFRSSLRSHLVAVCVLIVFTALGVRLVNLHAGRNDIYWDLVTSQQTVETEELFGRGRILDRQGEMLAFEQNARHVFISPEDIHKTDKVEPVADLLVSVLDLDRTYVMDRINRRGRYHELIQRFVPEPRARQIEDGKFYGVKFEDSKVRVYTFGERMAHVLGFANWKGVGSAGIEQQFDLYLRGTRGYLEGRKDQKSRELYQQRRLRIEAQAGADVELTIDRNIQLMVERSLDAVMEEYSAKGAWAIVQDVRTGEILGMASRPGYDPMNFIGTEPHRLRNQAISTVYEPGSTMKVLSLAAALEAGVVGPDTLLDCENGRWFYGGYPLNDHASYGHLTVADVLKKSSNIGTAKIAMKMGEKRFEEALREFGIGSKTGIRLPGEEAGIFHPRKHWSKISITRIPMGHGISATALQILNAVCAVANDGYLMRPRIVKRIVHQNGSPVLEYEPEVLARPIGTETARVMQRLMTRVTDPDGTGRRARLEGYPVAGKTGTAQKPEAGGYSHSKHIASFVGFAPSDDPRIGIIVVVDEPTPVHSGGYVAAPVWRNIAAEALPYLDVPARPEVEHLAEQNLRRLRPRI